MLNGEWVVGSILPALAWRCTVNSLLLTAHKPLTSRRKPMSSSVLIKISYTSWKKSFASFLFFLTIRFIVITVSCRWAVLAQLMGASQGLIVFQFFWKEHVTAWLVIWLFSLFLFWAGELLRSSMDEHNGSAEMPSVSQGRHGTIKCGWLRKQGGFVKTWHTRWFVLKGDQLYYFKDEDEIKPLVSDSPKLMWAELSRVLRNLSLSLLWTLLNLRFCLLWMQNRVRPWQLYGSIRSLKFPFPSQVFSLQCFQGRVVQMKLKWQKSSLMYLPYYLKYWSISTLCLYR